MCEYAKEGGQRQGGKGEGQNIFLKTKPMFIKYFSIRKNGI